ncbi:hypothetical protein DPMN_074586 [Dreissena polymorpha]|uniref:Uncharacterized protein n=1 Tax=Dreissena polymorpha TaxID=45954 RepID=A0A9D3YFN2_DREPO|nr:hypothetical protein DPMN_074586 [Dreissena polymorpha]
MVNCASLIVCRSSHGDVNEVTLIPEGEKILSAFQDFSRQSSHKTYVKKKEISAACIKRFTADDLNMDSSESEILKKYLEKSRGIVTKDVKAGLLKKLDGTDYSSAIFQ